MNRVCTVSIIKGTGECQAIVNGVVSKELQRQEELRKRGELERQRMTDAQIRVLEDELAKQRRITDRLLRQKLDAFEAEMEYELEDAGRCPWFVAYGAELLDATMTGLYIMAHEIVPSFLHGIADFAVNVHAILHPDKSSHEYAVAAGWEVSDGE